MWFRLSILLFFGVYSTYAVTLSPTVSVVTKVVGSRFSINCTSTNSITWTSATAGAMPSSTPTGTVSGNENISTLTFDNISLSNDATFRCQDSQGQDVSFQLVVFRVNKEDKTFEYLQDTVIPCSVSHPNKSLTFTYTWLKNSVAIKDLKSANDKWEYNELANGSLQLTKPTRELSGLWTCRAAYTDNRASQYVDVDVNYWASPYVVPFEKSKNLVQEEKLSVECSVLGHPKPVISWSKGGVDVTDDGHFKLETADTYNEEPIEHGRLVIQSVDFDDAGEYKCLATSPTDTNSTHSQSVLVRVKDKLAALWPFLGIVAEVVILCTIIFIYEKKRNKDASVDDEPAQDGTTPEKKSEGVRHRGGNNPRA